MYKYLKMNEDKEDALLLITGNLIHTEKAKLSYHNVIYNYKLFANAIEIRTSLKITKLVCYSSTLIFQKFQ